MSYISSRICHRSLATGKPMIITTNLQLSMLYSEPSLDKKRIYDRILENCVPVCVSGSSKRTAAGKEKMIQVKELVKDYQEGVQANE